MKVVLNREIGGFQLSDAAVGECVRRGMRLAEGFRDPTYDKCHFVPSGGFLSRYYPVEPAGRNAFRSHPVLVAVVEEMGAAAASSPGFLAVVDIPFDTTDGWYIAESEETGVEWVAENHRTWP